MVSTGSKTRESRLPSALSQRDVRRYSWFRHRDYSRRGPIPINPVRSPRFRVSASGQAQRAAFAIGVPPDICAYHRYTRYSTLPYLPQVRQYRMASRG